MKTILKLIVLAALVVGVVQYVLPALQKHGSFGARSSAAGDLSAAGETGAWDCVAAASAANDEFTAATRDAVKELGRRSGYSTIVEDARAGIEQARARCNCQHVACGKAERALDALEELVNVYGDMESGFGMANPASARDRLETLLNEARQAAGQG